MSVGPLVPEEQVVDAYFFPRWLAARAEQIAAASFLAIAALLRAVAVVRYRIDTDEPQHLHVVWGWTHGLLQYRDVFDNHMPLFQMLCVPLLRIVGERADALIAMRMPMVPLYAAAIALTYRIAASCYSRRVAMWSTVVASLVPGFLLCSVEFRTDDLWMVFWLLSIAVLVRAPLTIPRVALAGLALGMAAAVSAKTALLLLALAVGAAATVFDWRPASKGRATALAIIFLIGFVIPLSALALYFASRGAFQPFLYGAIGQNLIYRFRPGRLIAFVGLMILIAAVAGRVLRSDDSPAIASRRMFLFVTAHFYAAAMFCLWPLVEHEHWLPFYPLAAVTLVPLFFDRRKIIVLASVEVLLVIVCGELWRTQTRGPIAVVEQTLQLTAPGETVMDVKGETIFRPRASRYVLEPMTKFRIRTGKLRDTIVADILRTHTMVITPDHHSFPRTTRAFLKRNYVSVGAVRVAGQVLRTDSFRVQVPTEYAVVGEKARFSGMLDGRPYDSPRFLQAGMHTIAPVSPQDPVAIIWSRAAGRGLSPFRVAQDRQRRTPSRFSRYLHRWFCQSPPRRTFRHGPRT